MEQVDNLMMFVGGGGKCFFSDVKDSVALVEAQSRTTGGGRRGLGSFDLKK